jgi:uncharacterized protein YkwD
MTPRRLLLIAAAAMTVAALPGAASAASNAHLLAPPAACPGQSRASAPVAAREATMRCLVEFARRRAGLPGLRPSRLLAHAAMRKAHDVIGCRQFSHTACGLPFATRISQAGYRYRAAGENLAMGTGPAGAPRRVMQAWLESPGHRANLLRPVFRDQGIALRAGNMPGYPHALIWVNEFGARG